MSIVIRINREFDAPVERVFRAWTDAEDLAKWVWGAKVEDVKAEVDLCVGGRYCVSIKAMMESKRWPKRFAMRGMYTEIVPNKRLAYTVHWDAPVFYNEVENPPPDELAIVTFTPNGETTGVSYEHHGVPSEEAAAEHNKGISHTLDVLNGVVKR